MRQANGSIAAVIIANRSGGPPMKKQLMQHLRVRPALALIPVGLMLSLLAGEMASADEVNTGYFGNVAIEGYDTVAYFTDGKAIKGSEKYTYDWLGTSWHFASDEHRKLFADNPISYAPQFGGLCAEGIALEEI